MVDYDSVISKFANGSEFIISTDTKDINLILGNDFLNNEEILACYKLEKGKFKAYKYISRDIAINKIKNNFLVSSNDHPLLKLERIIKDNKNITYLDDKYIIYRPDSKRIQSKIHLESLRSEDIEDNKVTLLDGDFYDSNDYYQKKYHFFIRNSEVLSLRIGDEMYVINESGFILRRDNALECIGKVLNKINNQIDELTNNSIKEYKMIRKQER